MALRAVPVVAIRILRSLQSQKNRRSDIYAPSKSYHYILVKKKNSKALRKTSSNGSSGADTKRRITVARARSYRSEYSACIGKSDSSRHAQSGG